MSSAMFTALTALKSNQAQLDVIANDVANLNTPGYKGDRVIFSDLLSTTLVSGGAPSKAQGGTNPAQLGTGVQVKSIDTMMTQGSFATTGNPFDLAIEGAGLFVVRNGDETMYTRDGSFKVDAKGNVVTVGNGAIMQGWVADANGKVTSTTVSTDITIPIGMTMGAKATDSVSLAGNLAAGTATGGTAVTSLQVYDSQGTAHMVDFTFTKTAADQWSWAATSEGSAVGSGNITFDSTGKTTATGSVSIPLTTGAATPLSVSLDLTQVVQLAADSSVNATSQNGFPPAALQGVTIDGQGILTGAFSNGQLRTLGQVAIASFSNPSGLNREGNNLFTLSVASGLPNTGPARSLGRGTIRSGTLEQSNVDLATELTQTLVTQRSFQAATRLITTADEMYQDVISIKR